MKKKEPHTEDFMSIINDLMPKRKSKNIGVEYFNNGKTVMVTSDFGVIAMSSESWDEAMKEAAKNFDVTKINKDEKNP